MILIRDDCTVLAQKWTPKVNYIHDVNKSVGIRLTMSEGEKFLMRLKAKGYSTDRIGQGFVMHLPKPKRETQGTQPGNTSTSQKPQTNTES